VLFSAPNIAEAAVIGLPDEKWGEAVTAVLVSKPGEPIVEDELKAFCRSRLAGYKVPRRIIILDALPRNAFGKVDKPELRRLLGSPDNSSPLRGAGSK
jgi:acyl-CoA synthetase (AMP-forming)/AMP-acid ligase II